MTAPIIAQLNTAIATIAARVNNTVLSPPGFFVVVDPSVVFVFASGVVGVEGTVTSRTVGVEGTVTRRTVGTFTDISTGTLLQQHF